MEWPFAGGGEGGWMPTAMTLCWQTRQSPLYESPSLLTIDGSQRPVAKGGRGEREGGRAATAPRSDANISVDAADDPTQVIERT